MWRGRVHDRLTGEASPHLTDWSKLPPITQIMVWTRRGLGKGNPLQPIRKLASKRPAFHCEDGVALVIKRLVLVFGYSSLAAYRKDKQQKDTTV